MVGDVGGTTIYGEAMTGPYVQMLPRFMQINSSILPVLWCISFSESGLASENVGGLYAPNALNLLDHRACIAVGRNIVNHLLRTGRAADQLVQRVAGRENVGSRCFSLS